MSFFGPPPESAVPAAEPPAPYGPPIWTGPSELLLGTAIQLNEILAKTDEVAVVLERVDAYPNGFTFVIAFQARPPVPMDSMHLLHMRAMREPGAMPRFGVEFSDGRRVGDQFANPWDVEKDDEGVPTVPVMMPRGGGGGGSSFSQSYWVWPLPPDGPLTFHFQWTDRGVDDAKRVLDGTAIRAAGLRAVELWATGRDPIPGSPPAAPGGTWRTMQAGGG